MWVIAYFILENAVETVPQKWILDGQCYWPPYRGSKLMSAIADEHEVEDDWEILPIRILHKNKIYDDLIQARNACEKAQFTSDCSENESTKRKPKKKILNSSSSENEFDKKLPDVPEGFSEKKKKVKTNSQVEKRNNLPGPSQRTDPPPCVSTVSSGKEQRIKEFEAQVLRKLTNLTIRVQQIGDDVADIKETILNNNLNLKPQHEEDFDFNLPADSFLAFQNLEQFLEKPQQYEKLVVYLEKIGGNTTYDFVKRILSRIISNELLLEYNWNGLKGKKTFRDTYVAKATIEAIMKNTTLGATQKSIEEAIKSWLRHSKDRISRKENQQPV